MKEKLQARLREIEGVMKQALANYNALEGARQEVTLWLEQLAKDDKEILDKELIDAPV